MLIVAPPNKTSWLHHCPCITLKPLVPSFPCFANIHVSLMDKVCDDVYNYLPLGLYCTSPLGKPKV